MMMLFNLFVQLCLASFVFAAPAADVQTIDNAWSYGTGGGIIGLIVLVLDIIVFSKICDAQFSRLYVVWPTLTHCLIVEVLKSNRPPSHKLLWCLVVFLFPIIGMVLYYLFSNRTAHNDTSYEALP